MAHPHQYVGTGALPAVAGESYEESWKANPFPLLTNNFVPGQSNEITVTVTNYADDRVATRSVITSTTANPMPHVEYGRVSEN